MCALVDELGNSFAAAVQDLDEGSALRPDRYWEFLDTAHYDLNTCLRETVVLLNCFLPVLPEDQWGEFQATLQQQGIRSTGRVRSPTRNLARRRLAPIKGQ